MKNAVITFVAPNQVRILKEEIGSEGLGSHELLTETLYGLISAGTELSCLASATVNIK